MGVSVGVWPRERERERERMGHRGGNHEILGEKRQPAVLLADSFDRKLRPLSLEMPRVGPHSHVKSTYVSGSTHMCIHTHTHTHAHTYTYASIRTHVHTDTREETQAGNMHTQVCMCICTFARG